MQILSQAVKQSSSQAVSVFLYLSCAESMVKWRAKYGGMTTSMITKLKELEAENVHLKKKYADGRLKTMIVQEALTKKF